LRQQGHGELEKRQGFIFMRWRALGFLTSSDFDPTSSSISLRMRFTVRMDVPKTLQHIFPSAGK